MGHSLRIGLLVAVAVLGAQASADAQTQAGGSPAGRSTGAGTSATNGAVIAPPSASATVVAASRRWADPSFNRLVTARRASAAVATRGESVAGGPGMSGQDDLLRPYSARVREAQYLASTSTSRAEPRLVRQPPAVLSSRSYYPGMRGSQHPNANAPVVSGSRMGMGMGIGMGGRHCTPSRGAVMAGSLGRGR